MKYRKGIDVSKATEKELLRWHMENVTKESDEDIAGCANAMASLYSSFKNVHADSSIIGRFSVCNIKVDNMET